MSTAAATAQAPAFIADLLAREVITCTSCDGSGEIGVRQDYFGNWETSTCYACDGHGDMTRLAVLREVIAYLDHEYAPVDVDAMKALREATRLNETEIRVLIATYEPEYVSRLDRPRLRIVPTDDPWAATMRGGDLPPF